MTLWRSTPNQSARLIITVMRTRNSPSPTTQSRTTMTKAVTAPSAASKTIDSTVVEIDLSSIK